jgi:hypothetical protein
MIEFEFLKSFMQTCSTGLCHAFLKIIFILKKKIEFSCLLKLNKKAHLSGNEQQYNNPSKKE